MKALIAEDDFINRRVMQLFLAGYGKCDVADNGLTAMTMYREAHENKKPYALVCLDANLPEMDGSLLLKAIRTYEREHAMLGRDGARILFISEDASKDVILEAYRSQCDGLMLKPFRKRELIQFLHEHELVPDAEME